MPLGVSVHVDTSGIGVAMSDLESRKATFRAVSTGIKIVAIAAKARAPKRSGALKYSQGTKAKKGGKSKTGSFAVQGAKTKYKKPVKGGGKLKFRRPALYDHLVIGGVKPHSIRKGSKLARTLKNGEMIAETGQGVGKPHPGHRANPYRKQAYNAVRASVQWAMKLAFRIELTKTITAANAKTIQKLKKSARKAIGL
jgi:hypothetical protein